MKDFIAFVLPIATALAGLRIGGWVLGKWPAGQFGFGFRFVYGLAIGMLVFSHAVLFCAIAGFNGATVLARLVLIWGGVEILLLAVQLPAWVKRIKFQPGHAWLLLLLPVIFWAFVMGRLSTLEGTMEFDANATWVFRAKILYLEQGQNLVDTIRTSNLTYAHMDYPWLIGGIYTFGYGAVGGVDEFVNKVWPFWMMIGLCMAILSLAKVWTRPHPLPVAAAIVVLFLPGTLQFVRWEGGTVPMAFYASMVALLLFDAISNARSFTMAAAMPVIAGCAATKFEGVMYGVFWLFALLPFCWKYKWLTNKSFWKSSVFGLLCLMPFVWYRLLKPDSYGLNQWWREFQDWKMALPAFFKAFAIYLGGRFFNSNFFHWNLVNPDHVQWDGQWIGLASFANEQYSVLFWLLLVLLVLSFWKKRQKTALFVLFAVLVSIMAFLTLVLTGVAYIEGDVPHSFVYSDLFINWDSPRDIGRYFFPFSIAGFLAVITLWFPEDKATAPQAPQAPPHQVLLPKKKSPQFPKRRP
jgi:hypothetical protein